MGCLVAILVGLFSLVVGSLFTWGIINLIILLLGVLGIAIGFISFKVAVVITLIIWLLKAVF